MRCLLLGIVLSTVAGCQCSVACNIGVDVPTANEPAVAHMGLIVSRDFK